MSLLNSIEKLAKSHREAWPYIINSMDTTIHTKRVRNELRQSGIAAIGMLRFSSNYVPRIIRDDEHILAAVYGHRRMGVGIFAYEVGLLIATDKRVLYIVHRPGFTTLDEMNYELVSGVNLMRGGLFASVTLYSGITNYVLSFARPRAAQHFVRIIEEQLSKNSKTPGINDKAPKAGEPLPEISDNGIVTFLNAHTIGVLSSIERSGAISGATVCYAMINNLLYFMTMSGSKKVANIDYYHNVAFTVYDAVSLQTVQIQGIAEREADPKVVSLAENCIRSIQSKIAGSHKPPIFQLTGNICIYRIVPTKISQINYGLNK